MTRINPADCKPDEQVYYLIEGGQLTAPTAAYKEEKNKWFAAGAIDPIDDAEVTVLHRLVPEKPRFAYLATISEADLVEGLADSTGRRRRSRRRRRRPARLRLMVRDMRADDEAQRVEDALVEKTANAMRAAVHDGTSWAELSPTEAAEYRAQARAALAVFREEADQ